MSHLDWIKSTCKACGRWSETFSLLAAEAKPAEAMTVSKAAEWATFVTGDLGFPGQRRLFAIKDEAVRNQIGRVMQGMKDLHRRLVAAAETGDGSETSQVMLTIDSALQKIAAAMERIGNEDVDEGARLPDRDESPSPRKLGEDEVTPTDRPKPHLQEGSDARRASPRPASTPRPRVGPDAVTQPRAEGTPRPRARPEAAAPPARPEGGAKPRFKPVTTAEDAVIPLTQKKGDSTLAPLPVDPTAPAREGSDSGARRRDAARSGETPTEGRASGGSGPHASDAAEGSGSASAAAKPLRGPLRPAALDPRVALLRTYVKRLDREVMGAEEESALEQVVAILGGALSADEDTLARRFRYLDQQYAADDASVFSEPLMRDLTNLLQGLTERAMRRLRHACELAQGDRLLFVVGNVSTASTPEWLPVVALATAPHGLREGLLPSYLPRLRGPSAGFTFNVGTREGAALVRRLPENRLEFGFIAGPTRLWLTALHVHRNGLSGALNIEPGGDDQPAYFEARLALPATEETYKVAARFVLAETTRFVDRVATA